MSSPLARDIANKIRLLEKQRSCCLGPTNQTFFISFFFLVLWAPEVSLCTNDDRFCLWLLQRVSSCSLGLAIALGSFTSSPFEARLGLGSVSLIAMDDKTFDVCSGFTFFVNCAERSVPIIARFVFQATPFLATVGRLVLKGLFLFCCCVLVLEQGVDGLADSAFAVDYLLFQFPFFSPLEHSPLSTSWKISSLLVTVRGGNDWD